MARRPPDIHGMTSLKVDNLTYRTTMDDLRHHFGKFGEIGDIYIPRDNYSMESRGFAFVRYFDKRDAEDAIDSMDGKVVDGRELRCAMAKYGRPDTERESRRGSRGGGGGRYGGYGGYGGGRGGDRGYRSRRDRSRSRSRSRSRRSRSRSRSRSRRHDRSNSRKSDDRKSASPARVDSPRRSADKSPRRDSRSPSRSRSRSRSHSR